MLAHNIPTESIGKQLNTNIKTGLLKGEALKRLKKHGPNRIKEAQKKSPLIILLHQFLSPLMYILLIATIASLFIGEINDAIVIGIAVALNSIIGFIQEWKAEKASLTLKSYEVPMCNVLRNGKVEHIKAESLVPGDIVLLAAGSRIPADIRLFHSVDFTVEEALLTGESHPIKKTTDKLPQEVSLGERTNIAYSGTYAVSGKAKGIVVATGKSTELGKIANLIIKTKTEKTPLQKHISRFSRFLGWLMLGITIGIFALGLFKQLPLHEMIITSIALAVAAIPEGLLVAVTVILAIGMQRMLKRNALVRHLVAAETLGSVSTICTDKTGTLTKGHMAVNRIITPKSDLLLENIKTPPADIITILQHGILNNDAQIIINNEHRKTTQRIGNPTEIALLQAAHDLQIPIKTLQEELPRIDEIPFSSTLKYMATLHKTNDHQKIIVKGASEKILSMCTLSEEELKNILKKTKELTHQGLRLLAFAEKITTANSLKNNLHDLIFTGIVGLQDPLREHAHQTIEELTKAGIRTIVVTGDHQETAKNITRGAGIFVEKNNIMTGIELSQISDQELNDRIRTVDLFARVDPKDKIRIVKAWKNKGESVAMIGDGVNDAPALKAADIGVALGSGTDVAHEISDMVLLDNNLSTISAAVKEGRIIFENIQKVITYLLSDCFGEIILIAGALLCNIPLPLSAIQILWINIISDGFPAMAFTSEPGEEEIMKEPPRKMHEPIITKEMKYIIFVVGIIVDLIIFFAYLFFLHKQFDLLHSRTIVFTSLSINSLIYAFSLKSFRKSLIHIHIFNNPILILAIAINLLLQLAVVYAPPLQKLFSTIPLGFYEWVIIGILSITKIIGIEITKRFFLQKQR